MRCAAILLLLTLFSTRFRAPHAQLFPGSKGPCEDEEEALQVCFESAYDPIVNETQNDDDDDVFVEQCANEIDAYEQCLVDNGISESLDQCKVFLRMWNSCMIAWNGILVCRGCTIFFDDTCEEFEENTCDRYNCCFQCQHFLTDYIGCVQDSNVCDEEYFDCEENRQLGFWEKVMIGLLAVGLVAIGLLLLSNHRKDQQLRQQQKQQQEPSHAVLASSQSFESKEADRLKVLSQMAKNGTITEEEYGAKKAEIVKAL